jgi:hypothetical protein
VLAVALLGPAVAELLHILIIVMVVLVAVAGGSLVAFGAWRLRQTRQGPPRLVHRIPPRTAQAVPRAPRAPARARAAPAGNPHPPPLARRAR